MTSLKKLVTILGYPREDNFDDYNFLTFNMLGLFENLTFQSLPLESQKVGSPKYNLSQNSM